MEDFCASKARFCSSKGQKELELGPFFWPRKVATLAKKVLHLRHSSFQPGLAPPSQTIFFSALGGRPLHGRPSVSLRRAECGRDEEEGEHQLARPVHSI